MPLWVPEPFWSGQDVYAIGGGPSLTNFDWNILKGKYTIGCNSAYKLGKEICQICFFGDGGFWKEHKKAIESFQGLVITNSKEFRKQSPPWLFVVERKSKGCFKDHPGWNGNSGACIVNLALILGAKRVCLLGYDMKAKGNQVNWYRKPGEKKPAPYNRFALAFNVIAAKYKELFPGTEIINVTDDSDLNVFPKVGVKEWFSPKET